MDSFGGKEAKGGGRKGGQGGGRIAQGEDPFLDMRIGSVSRYGLLERGSLDEVSTRGQCPFLDMGF
jgi:hypothetical protein